MRKQNSVKIQTIHFPRSIRAGVVAMCVGVGVLTLAFAAPASAAVSVPGDPLFLGEAAPFSVLAYSTVTNSGAATFLDRDLGVSPGSTTPGMVAGNVAGAFHLADAVAGSAQTDVTAAAVVLMGLPSYNVGAADLANTTFTAGSYSSATSLLNSGVITLVGDADDVFIFTAVSDLTTGAGSSMAFQGGAQECNVFWRIGSSAALGTSSRFVGNLLAQGSVSVGTDATIAGRLFAQTGQVSLLNNVFTSAACSGVGDGSTTGPSGAVAGTSVTPPTGGVPSAPAAPPAAGAPSAVTPPAVTPSAVTPVAPVAPAAVVPAATAVTAVDAAAEGVLALTGLDVQRPFTIAAAVMLLGIAAAMLSAARGTKRHAHLRTSHG